MKFNNLETTRTAEIDQIIDELVVDARTLTTANSTVCNTHSPASLASLERWRS